MRTREKLVAASGLSRKTLGEIERADRTSYDPATIATVEQTLKWPPGTVDAILAGLRPPPDPAPPFLPDVPGGPLPPELALLVRVYQQLPDGELRRKFLDRCGWVAEWAVTLLPPR